MNNKIILSFAMTLVVATVFAAPIVHHDRETTRLSGGTHVVSRVVTHGHSTFSGPDDSFHDTYKRNTGRLNDEAPKRIANLHAKISAAQADAEKRAARAARANEPTISVYSNYDALFKKPPPEEKPTVVVNKQINISNSTVVIN